MTLFLKALNGKNYSNRPPIWIMRQAGRYMPEYREIRKKHSFLEMCHTPELVVEITQLPIREFDMDAAILFSDILVIPEALKVGLRFEDSVGPIIERPLSSPEDLKRLPKMDMEDLEYVKRSIQELKKILKVPLIGFSGAPFTLAAYMIEGKSSKDWKKTKKWLFNDPKSFHLLLEKLTQDIILYLKMQIESGVQAIQLFDSWANILGYRQFREFSHNYLEKIVNAIKPYGVPIILFCRGSSTFGCDLAELQPNGISFDWNIDITKIRKQIPATICLQGNLDPDVLYAPKSHIIAETRRILNGMKNDPAFIFNLGHGVYPDTPVEAVRTLVETVKEGA